MTIGEGVLLVLLIICVAVGCVFISIAESKSYHDGFNDGIEYETIRRMTYENAERKGKWNVYAIGRYTCSCCNFYSHSKSNFCPNCGTRMVNRDAE